MRASPLSGSTSEASERGEGEFSNGKDEHNDVKSALNVLSRWPGIDRKRIGVIGYSAGASIILDDLRHMKRASAIALISPTLGRPPKPTVQQRQAPPPDHSRFRRPRSTIPPDPEHPRRVSRSRPLPRASRSRPLHAWPRVRDRPRGSGVPDSDL